tara:strand:- start:946 stop:1137 length:192 start_codon:yes stop_codon:yes gene_type:complete
MEMLTEIMAVVPAWVSAITALVVAANGITMLTPTTSDDKIVGALLSVLNFLSMNVLKNKNLDE